MYSLAAPGRSDMRRYHSGSLGVGSSFIVLSSLRGEDSRKLLVDLHEDRADSPEKLHDVVDGGSLQASSEHDAMIAARRSERQMTL